MIIRKQWNHNKTAILGLIIIFLFGFALSAHAATVTWTGGGADNLASNPSNWSGNTMPQYGDNVIFDSTSKNCTWDLNVSLASLSIKLGYTGKVTKATGVSLTIAANFVPPTPPSGLNATAISSSQINLSWTDNSNNETGFKIERKTGAGGTYSQIALAGVNVTTYSDTGLIAGTTYYYKVRAYNSFDDSAYSNEAYATTVAVAPTVTTEPATSINGNAATLNATVNPNSSETTVYFEWWTDINNKNTTSSQSIGSGTSPVNVSANITGLSPNTTYYYRVIATNAGGTNYGSDVSFITSAATTGTIQVNATLDGANWYGSVNFTLTGSETINGASTPATFSGKLTGTYTLSYNSGGPSNAALSSITPSVTQTLGVNETITYTLNFISPPASNWYNTNWQYRQQITISSTMTQTDLTNFPVLIKITDQNNPVFNNAQADGNDILFTNDGVTKLDHEIEYYQNTGTKELDAWVKIPALSSSQDTVIYIYYGNSSAFNQENPQSVWDSSYKGVWHLKEKQTGTGALDLYKDSTANNNHGDDFVSAAGQEGQINSGQEFDGSDDYINAANDASLGITSQITIEAWIKIANPEQNRYMRIVSKKAIWNSSYGYELEYNPSTNTLDVLGSGGNYGRANSVNLDTNWHYVSGVINGTTATLYVDGINVTTDNTVTALASDTRNLHIGKQSGGTDYFNGSIDEVRISSIIRSADWIKASFNSQKTPGTYLSYGAEESSGGTTTGTIQVNATLDGANWSGSVNYSLTGPETINGASTPATFSGKLTGTYTLSYNSGGPSNAALNSITPSAAQTLQTDGTITFTLAFTQLYPPAVTTNPATYITANTATLNAIVNPNGLETTVYFEWWTDINNKNTTSSQSIGNGTSNVSVGFFIEGLTPGITYHYRVAASNANVTAYGNDMTFTTIPGTDVRGYITTNTTWTLAGSPYVITDNVFVYGTSSPMLTIEPGVEIRFIGNGLYIGSNWYEPGILKAQGTPSNPIVFTSNNPNPAPGDWQFIQFEDNSASESILEYVIVEYGGWWEPDGWTNIFVSDNAGGNLRIKNSIIRYSKGSGIQLSGVSLLTLTDSSIVNNESDGVEAFGWGDINITGSTISNNGGMGIYFPTNVEEGSISIIGSTISNNGSYGIYAGLSMNVSISFSTIKDNPNYAVSSRGTLKLNHCNITGNGNGIYSYASEIADARFNWWGDASGPSGQGPGSGQSVSYGVNFEPWLGAPFTYPFYNMDLTATLQEFSPLNNSVTYTFSISENSNWTFSIKNSSGTTVKTFTGAGASGTVPWDGKDESGVIVPDGIYTYQLSSTSLSNGSQSAPLIGDVKVNSALPKAEITYPVNGQFVSGSNLLNIQGTATDIDFKDYKLEYGVGTSPTAWMLIDNLTTPVNSGTLKTWDMSNLTGTSYTIRLSVTDNAGNTATASVELNLLNIYSITVSNPAFSPNGDGYKDTTTITASITYSSDWTLDIKNSGSTVVRSFSGNGTSVSAIWDGKDTSGVIQPEGLYSFTITATEPISSAVAAVTGNITIYFPLPPIATTNSATNITTNSATLNATVNPNGLETTVYFEWWTDINNKNTTSSQSIGSGTSPISVSANLTGLSPNTTYYYRIVAANEGGTNNGNDMTFTSAITVITGTVTNSSTTAMPLPDVEVTIVDSLNNSYITMTDSNGLYTVSNLAVGSFTATFEKSGFIQQAVNGSITTGQTLTINIQLAPIPITVIITSPKNGDILNSTPESVTGYVFNTAGSAGGNNEALAQSFKPTNSGTLDAISLTLLKIGSPDENLIIKITTAIGDRPIAVSDPVRSTGIDSQLPMWKTFSFSSPVTVTAGNTYYIELWREKRDVSNYIEWKGLSGFYIDNYPDGEFYDRDNGIWSGSIHDLTFRIYINNTLDVSQNFYDTLYPGLYGLNPYPVNVIVNSIQASVSGNTFSATIPLVEGANTLTAYASDQYSHTNSDSINVTLVTKGSITGTITDSSTGLPIPSATVSVTDSLNVQQTTSTATNGTYTINNIAQGAFSGSVTKSDYTAYNFSGTMSPGQTITISASLSPVPPAISNITVSNITNNSATITWETDQLSDSLVEYGETTLYGQSVADSTLTTSHSITLTGLTMGTLYHFRVTSTNALNASSTSSDNTFTTYSPITITITSPLNGDTINKSDVIVKGTISNTTGNETGVTVNGMVATVYGNQFIVNHVPLTDGSNTITANATDTAGNTAKVTITVNAVTTTPHVTLNANIESGIAPLTIYFSVSTSIPNAVSTYQFDYEGDGSIDYTGSTFDNISFTYNTEDIYYPTVIVTDTQGITYSDTIAIVVLNASQLDALLRAKWEAMRNSLSIGDTATALTYIFSGTRTSYQEMFNALISQLPSIVATQTEFNLIYIKENVAEFELVTSENGTIYSYEVIFTKDNKGIWMIQDF